MGTVPLLAIHLAVATWVWTDARKRDWSDDGFANAPWKWALGVALLWYLALPTYVLRRAKRPLAA